MNTHDLIRELREPAKTKIVLLVADGLGGLPLQPGGMTELETASTPNLDAAALRRPVGVGSGPFSREPAAAGSPAPAGP